MSSVSIDVDPDTFLVFRGDFCNATSVKISVRNVSSDKPAIFKIKATFPHRYVVKPHRGEIPPSSNLEIDVTLLPFHFRETEKYNDKFLLQACASTKINKEYSKHDFWSMVPKEELYERKLRCVFKYSPPELCDEKGVIVDDLPDGQVEDRSSDNISSTSILKEKIQDISVEEEAKIQKKLSQAKAEIQNLILEGQRLKKANQQLQNDIDSHTSSPKNQPSNNNGVKLNGATESDMSGSSNSSGSKRSFQLGSKSKIEIIMESKVAFVLVCIVVMWLGIGMGKFIM